MGLLQESVNRDDMNDFQRFTDSPQSVDHGGWKKFTVTKVNRRMWTGMINYGL